MSDSTGRPDARIRSLAPISRLSVADQQAVLSQGMFLTFSRDEVIYAQGREDSYANYLLEGSVDFLWNGKLVKTVDTDKSPARRALDGPGPKRYTVRARSWSIVLRLPRSELEKRVRFADSAPESVDLEVSDIESEQSSSWMVRILQSQRFANLPPQNIQRIFERMERVNVTAGELIVRQGDPGGYYYVIEEGYCDVTRVPAGGGHPVHLAELGPGDGFGEEALISNSPRNASVTMQSDGVLMRLDKESFVELIRDPLINRIYYAEAKRMIDEGAVWLDVRHRDQFARAALHNAKNIPRAMLRAECRRLVKGRKYIVCAEDPADCATSAFLLAERGYDVSYLGEPLSRVFDLDESAVRRAQATPSARPPAEAPPGTVLPFPPAPGGDVHRRGLSRRGEERREERTPDLIERSVIDLEEGYGPAAPAPRQEYADTVTGERLANLVDEINNRYRDLESSSDNTTTGDTLLEGLFDVESLAGAEPEKPEQEIAAEQARPPPPPPPRSTRSASSSGTRLDVSIPEEELAEITREMELRLRRAMSAFAAAQRLQYEELLTQRVAALKQAAMREIQRKAEKIRQTYRAKYEAKEQALRRHYQRLARLANKITRQKAEIQNARRELEEKLRATDDLYREVDEIRRLLKQRIGTLEGLDLEDDNQSAS